MAFKTTQENTPVFSGDAEYKELEKQKLGLRTEIAILGTKLEEMENQHSSFDDLSSECADLASRKESLIKESDALAVQIRNAESELKSVMMVLDTRSREAAALSDSKAELEQVKKETEQARSEFVAVASKNNATVKASEQELESIKSDIEKAKEKRRNYEIELSYYTNNIDKAKKEKEERLIQIDGWDKEVSRLSSAASALSKEIDEARVVLGNLAIDKRDAESEIADMKSKFEDYRVSEEQKLADKRLQMEKREGDVSVREERLSGRADYLRNQKARLEHYLGKSIDLIIE